MHNNYSQRHSLSDTNKDPDMDNAMSTLEDCFSYSRHKKRMYESSSDDDDDNQHCDGLTEEEISNITFYDVLTKHYGAKKKRIESEDAVDNTEEKYNHWQEIEAVGTQSDESKNNNSHVEHSKSTIGKAQRMMENMGYQPGVGLGKHGQGRVEPIEPVMQCGRRGFGHYIPGLKEASLKWDPAVEEIKAVEDMAWLRNTQSCTLTSNILQDWIQLGPKKQTIDDEISFCSEDILQQIIDAKTVFDKLDKVEMRKARTRSNPYETIRSACFLNRAAVKMANINKACNFMLTDTNSLGANELLYFADVCAGPGGFSEYILSRKKWHAKGFGFTLKNENDFTLDEFYAGPCETFHPFYGSKNNGDVFDPINQEEFRSLIMKHTNGKGVHFMMSDGGFSVEGQENIQEILSKQLYLCQCLVALMIVRTGGHFVTKLFDLFTPFSAGLVYLMHKCFDSICIFKPNSSRPANSERYLICKRKRPDTQAVMEYLSRVNHLLLKNDDSDVTQMVPLAKLKADEEFFKYFKQSNDILGEKQVTALLKIAAFCENPTLTEPKQADMRKECLKHWDLSDKSRVRPFDRPQDKIKEILNNTMGFIGCEAQKLTKDNIRTTILNQPHDWYCMPCSSGQYVEEDKAATFYLGLGRRRVFRYVKGKWEPIGDVKLELPPNTLVYAELVYETRWTGKFFIKSRALHILDAYMIGGENVSKRYITHRHELTKKLCDALWKPSPHDYVPVRAKEIFMFGPGIEKKLRASQRRVKSVSVAYEFAKNPLERDNESDREPLYSPFNSVLFLRSTAHPWSRHISQKTNYFYVYNPESGETQYERCRPPQAEASFIETFERRIIWHWPQDNGLDMNALVQILRNPSHIT